MIGIRYQFCIDPVQLSFGMELPLRALIMLINCLWVCLCLNMKFNPGMLIHFKVLSMLLYITWLQKFTYWILLDVITNNVNFPPSIMINVTGLVAHGKTAVNDLTDGKSLGNKRILDDLLLPRTFSQTFILRNENENWFIICKFTINKEKRKN